MITWTETGRAELERHLASVRTRMIAAGADVREVEDDLVRHVETELSESGLRTATREDVRRVLAQIGGVETGLLEPREERQEPSQGWFFHLVTACCWLLGVVVPAATLIVELSTRMCAAEIFDPLPTWFHALLVACVPVANALGLVREGKLRAGAVATAPVWLRALNGAALAISACYALMFLVVTPIAVIGVVFFGLGLLPLAPLMGFITACIVRRRLRKLGNPPGRAGRWAACAALAFLVVWSVPSLVTEIGVRMTRSKNPETVLRGLSWLRGYGDEDRLLDYCYFRNTVMKDLPRFVLAGWDSHFAEPFSGNTIEEARMLYYRTTGVAYDRVPRPSRFAFGGRPTGADEWEWDADRGGEVVGQRLRHLSLTESRLDGSVDGKALAAYLEWTFVFENSGQNTQEARAEIVLPPGGVVSRLTLWVNGEEREAAFAGRGQVREAYQRVAIRQNRDPVLVTSKGPDRVFMQCFPVPAHGEMKVRLGITAPVLPPAFEEDQAARIRLPVLGERNFRWSDDFAHNLWLESSHEVTAAGLKMNRQGSAWVAYGAVAVREGELPLLHVRMSGESGRVWSAHRNAPETVVMQQLVETESHGRKELVLAIEGSKALERHRETIAGVIENMEAEDRLTVWLAGDRVEGRSRLTPAEAARWLRGKKFAGGQDSVPALSHAWDAAAAQAETAVIWLHGGQPLSWNSLEGLTQKQVRSDVRVPIRSFSLDTDGNLLLEKLDGVMHLTEVPRFGNTARDLADELRRQTRGGGRQLVRTFRSVGVISDPEQQERGGHVARLWAADEIRRLAMGSARRRAQAVSLAQDFQLVTSVSGAVVLETKQQFDEVGLASIDPATAPNIPEPATVALVLGMGAAVFVVWRKRRRVRAGVDPS